MRKQIKAQLVDYMGSDKRVVDSARVSFAKHNHDLETMTDRDKKLINYLASNLHTSPFEHCSATFILDVPLFVARQIMRHRTFSYNEVSRRYTSEDLSIWSPSKLRKQAVENRQCSAGELKDDEVLQKIYEQAIEASWLAYHKLLEAGVSRELARAVLPQSTMTSFYMTGNLLNWVKFIRLRDDKHAQPETAIVAQQIKAKLFELFPESMKAYFKD